MCSCKADARSSKAEVTMQLTSGVHWKMAAQAGWFKKTGEWDVRGIGYSGVWGARLSL